MLNSHIILKKILRDNPIVPYLGKMGHVPMKAYPNGRHLYRCPMPDHNEKKPSFVVYTNDEYENFYCFGCGSKHNIVHLMSRLEAISYREALRIIGSGAGVVITDYFEEALRSLDQEYVNQDERDTSKWMSIVASKCRRHLNMTRFAGSELRVVDFAYKQIDDALVDLDFDRVVTVSQDIKNLLNKRMQKIQELRG